MSKRHKPPRLGPEHKGAIPADIKRAGIMVFERPTDAWKEAHPDFEVTGEQPTADEDVEVAIMLTTERREPSALFPGLKNEARWPTSGVRAVMPLFICPRNVYLQLTPIINPEDDGKPKIITKEDN